METLPNNPHPKIWKSRPSKPPGLTPMDTTKHQWRLTPVLMLEPITLHVITRGVQYVHWVMHKCIMVKVGGEIYM